MLIVVVGCGSGRTISTGPTSAGATGASSGSGTGGTATVDYASQIQPISNAQPRSGGQIALGSDPLSAAQLALIRAWIDEGAPTAR